MPPLSSADLSLQRGESLIRDLRYMNYREQRRNGARPAQLAAHYPRAEAFERQYQDELGARIADDVFSPSGERGRSFDREEPRSYSSRMHGDGR